MSKVSKNMDSMQIPLSKPFIGRQEEIEINKVLRSGWLIHGPYAKRFEDEFARYIGTRYAIAANSCTSVLQLSLICANYDRKDESSLPEIILPSFTFVASANAIVNAGFKPIFVDINQNTFNISPGEILKSINRNTFGIMVVHYAGQSCRMDEICKIARKYKLVLIEDSAEAIGAEFKRKKTGSFGIGCFSFFPTKNLTTGEGGMLTTNDAQLAERIRALIAHGISSKTKKKFSWNRNATFAGFNFRMTDLQAALGVVQLKKIDYMNERRRAIAHLYNKKISNIEEIALPFEDTNCKHVYQMYTPMVKNTSISRDKLVKLLNERGIGASVHFDPPVHKQYFYKKMYKNLKLPVTEEVSKRIFTLPIYPSLKEKDAKRIIKVLKQCIYTSTINKYYA